MIVVISEYQTESHKPVAKVEEAISRAAPVYPLSSEVKWGSIVLNGLDSTPGPVSGLDDENVVDTIFDLEHQSAFLFQ